MRAWRATESDAYRRIEGNQPIRRCQFLSQETWQMNRQCFWWFLAAGLTISVAIVCIYYALDLGKVSVVIPIASTGPFFSLILAATFLHDVERVTSKDRSQRCHDRRRGGAAYALEVIRAIDVL